MRHLAPNFNLLKVQRMEVTDAEKDVDFLGFVILENRLKPESSPVIKELQVRKGRKGQVLNLALLKAVSEFQMLSFSAPTCAPSW